MIYYIYKNDKLVSTQKSINKASLYIKNNYALRGFSNRTLKTKLSNDNYTYSKNGVTVIKKQNFSNTRVINKKIRTYQDINIGRTNIINYQRPIKINTINMDDFIANIMNKIKRKGLEFIQKNKIKVVIRGTPQFGILNTIGTAYLNFNSLYEDLLQRLSILLMSYDTDEFEVSTVDISYVEVPPMDEVIIYKGKEDTVKTFINDIFNMKINDKEKFIKFISKYQIISPNTTKNCFIKACFIAKYKKTNIDKHVEKFIRKHKNNNLVMNTKTLAPLLKNYLEVNINVHFIDTDIKVINYNLSKEYNTIDIVIKGGHAFALIEIENTENKKEFTKQEKIEMPEYKDKYGEWGIATYDLETCDKENDTLDKNNTEVYALGYFNGSKYYESYKNDKNGNVLKSFINFLYNTECSKKIIYAHNGGRFDTFLLLKELLISNLFIITSYLESNGRIINMKIISTSKEWKKQFIFRDSYNLITCSLDKACKDFKPKTQKLTGDVDHDKININNCYTKKIYDYTKKYLKNDCISLYEILCIFNSKLESKYNFGIRDTLTNAGTARRVFLEKHYDDINKPLYTLDRDTDQQLRKYYFGGRNECMTKLGYNKGKFYYVDFTSLYPYVMKKNKYFYGKMTKLTPKDNSKFNNKWFGFVKVLFRNTNKNNIPLHGVLHKIDNNNKLVFPHVDKWTESIISTEEIKYSIKNKLGYEYKFLEVYQWNKRGHTFKTIIDELYKWKIEAQKKGNKAERSIAKIVINSTYGFFGINYMNRDQVQIINEKATKTKTVEEARSSRFTGYLLDQKLKSYNKYGKYDVYGLETSIQAKCANVGIASLVTSYARLELYKLLKAIKEEGGNIYYMDTDSVITDLNIYNNDKFKSFIGSGGENLGELTNETEEDGGYYTELITLGNKMYALKNNNLKDNKIIIKMKGVNSKQKYKQKIIDKANKKVYYKTINKLEGDKKIEFEDYKLLAEGYELIVDNMNFITGSKEMVIKDKGLVKQRNTKTITSLYDKANVNNNNIITPLVI